MTKQFLNIFPKSGKVKREIGIEGRDRKCNYAWKPGAEFF
jgi:hypothetical protein